MMEELWAIKKATSQHTNKYFLHANQLRSDVAAPKEPVRDRQYKDIFKNVVSDEYPKTFEVQARLHRLRNPGSLPGRYQSK